MSGAWFNGTTSKAQDAATALTAAIFTLCGWVQALGQGGGGFGRVLQADELVGGTGANGWNLSHNNSANTLFFAHATTSSFGNWTFPCGDSLWRPFSLTFNRNAIGNNPSARVSLASVTVTNILAQTGTYIAPLTGYNIGNRGASDRGWNGGLMHLQYHPVALSAADQDKANRYPGSVRTNGAKWWPLLTGTYLEMWEADGVTWARGLDPVATALSSLGTSPTCAPRRLISVPGPLASHLLGRVRAA
jgi:hypothetical protein